jgi:hypothetical protein
VSALEQRLKELGRELAFPPEPDLAPAVRARLGGRPFPWRRVALALAVAAMALAAALAVPQARSALLRFFHLRGVTVERVETLPPARERSQSGGLGPVLARAEAERRLGFRLALPPLADGHARVHLLDGALATVVLRAHGHAVLLSEFRARGFDLLKKLVSEGSVVGPAYVNGEPGLWLEGPPHTLTYFDQRGEFRQRTVRVHGNVLLWTRGEVTLRLEGRLSKPQALQIARTVR